jgi:SAM-dependent methyltransferase
MNTKRFQQYLNDVQKTVYTEQPWDCHEQIVDASFKKYVERHKFNNALDIGCGYGYALKKFRNMGIIPTGVTLDGTEFKQAKDSGFNVHFMDMNFLDFDNGCFDLVWCRHALEHSIMPYVALREFNSVLKDDGYMYVEVPSDVFFHINNESHYSMLSDIAWQVLFRKTGFSLLDRGQYSLNLTDSDSAYLYWSYWLKKVKTFEQNQVNA